MTAAALVTAEANEAIVLSTSCVIEVTGVPAATKVVGMAVGRMSEAGDPVASTAVCTSVTIVARDMAMVVFVDRIDVALFGSAQQRVEKRLCRAWDKERSLKSVGRPEQTRDQPYPLKTATVRC